MRGFDPVLVAGNFLSFLGSTVSFHVQFLELQPTRVLLGLELSSIRGGLHHWEVQGISGSLGKPALGSLEEPGCLAELALPCLAGGLELEAGGSG